MGGGGLCEVCLPQAAQSDDGCALVGLNMDAVTPGLWDFAAAAAWERQIAEEKRDREDDDSSERSLSPTVGLSPAELWLRSLDEPGATLRVRREREEQAALVKLTPLERIKQRMLADAAAREQQESVRHAAEAHIKQLATLPVSADDNKGASRHELRRLHNEGQADQRKGTPAEEGDTRVSEGARERFFRALSRPNEKRSTGRRIQHQLSSSSSSSSSEESGSDTEPDERSTRDVRRRRNRTRRRAGAVRRDFDFRGFQGGENLRRAAAAAALPPPEESEHATQAKAQLMSQSDGDLLALTARESRPGVTEEFSGLRWALDSDEDDDQAFGKEHVPTPQQRASQCMNFYERNDSS